MSSPPDPVVLRIDDLPRELRLHVHGERDRHVSRRLREEGIWEPCETALVMSLLGAGDVCVDVGANIGYFTVLAAALVGPRGRVVAFEPDAANCALLRRNVAGNGLDGRVHSVEGALGERDGTARLHLSEDNYGDHQLYRAGGGRRSRAVSVFNGADYLRGRVPRIDLLKVDVQGAEFAVMAGLMPLLAELPSCPRILIELTPWSLRAAGSSGRELIELMASLGQPFWIVDHLEHRLAASTAADLARWCDNVQNTPGDRGFMNILVGAAA